jgi:hypothetical protein
LSELRGVRDKASWRDTLLRVLRAWNRHQVWKILTAIVVIWIVSGTALYFAERGTNPAFKTWRESLWNVWVTLFSGLNNAPNSPVGRLVIAGVLVVGVALAGLFTASVASILIERSLRSREVPKLEMSDHLVLCNWSPRALELDTRSAQRYRQRTSGQSWSFTTHPTKSCCLTNRMKPPSTTSISSKVIQPTK